MIKIFAANKAPSGFWPQNKFPNKNETHDFSREPGFMTSPYPLILLNIAGSNFASSNLRKLSTPRGQYPYNLLILHVLFHRPTMLTIRKRCLPMQAALIT